MRTKDQPTFLTEVMDTIASLKETKGTPAEKIIDHLVSSRRAPMKNASLQIKKALRTGLKTGLLKEVSGKFKLGLDPKDYAVFKRFRQLEKNSGSLPVRESKKGKRGRRRRGRSKRRRGRGRRRSYGLSDDIMLQNESSPEPMDKGRRRRKKRSRRRRKAKRGRRYAVDEVENESDRSSQSKEVAHKSSEEKPKTAKSQQGRNDKDRNETNRGDQDKTHADVDSLGSNHCFHGLHQENDHTYGPQTHGHYGEYYDH